MKIQKYIKKTLLLLMVFSFFAGFMSCEDNIFYPVNRVEIYHNGSHMLTSGIAKIPANAPYQLSAVFFNSKNEILDVPDPEFIIWTDDCPTRKFEPEIGVDVSFNSVIPEEYSEVYHIYVEYKDLPRREIRFQLQ
ncbi:MAG: hypothetical protein LBR69_07830 [Endomicrobium sp.]|jgi:hypothetical protein|nr:hypothetical protein [Endomicrobium sp.]